MFLPAILLALLATTAQAVTVKTFSPQGQVQQVRQVRAAFSDAMVGFGDPKAQAPFDIQCSAPGSGRWADERNWIYDFDADLKAGQSCTFTARAGLASVAGSAIEGTSQFQFKTGGPVLALVNGRVDIQPSESSTIDPKQVFVLNPNGVVNDASLLKNMYCQADGVRERIPVKLVTGKEREQLLSFLSQGKRRQKLKTDGGATVRVVQCQQTLPFGRRMELVWGKGITTANGVATTEARHFSYTVREEFRIEFSCERENAQAACLPLGNMTLKFSSAIDRKWAEQVVLKTSDGKRKPKFSDDEGAQQEFTELKFPGPFPQSSEASIELPSKLVDLDDYPPANASQFPLKVNIAAMPPLVKFATAPFGILELNADPAMPLTVRNVEAELKGHKLQAQGAPGKLSKLKVSSDADIIKWMSRLAYYHENSVTDSKGRSIESRRVGIMGKQPGVEKIDLPVAGSTPRQFEVLGIPFKDPGFYVMEVQSQLLGRALLGEDKAMYVRSSALVTNLAVHVKIGRENGMLWVTTLDQGKPVADAELHVSNCHGKLLWSGKSSADGTAMLPSLAEACPSESGMDESESQRLHSYFVSARKKDDKGRADMAFALSNWHNGLEPWRFNVPTETQKERTVRMHTVFDRSLFRAGEKVSMKHMIRAQTHTGFALVKNDQLPRRVRIIHGGSGQEFQFALNWHANRRAETVFAIPPQAKLGQYNVVLDRGTVKDGNGSGNDDEQNRNYEPGETYVGSFRVEEFRLPVLTGKIVPAAAPIVAPKELPLSVQLNYLNGGGASGMAVTLTSLMRERSVDFAGYDGYSFNTHPDAQESEGDNERKQTIIADKQPLTLDKNGAGKSVIKAIPAITEPQDLVTEMTFADPNGEIQTISSRSLAWPANVVVGIAGSSWVSVKSKLTLRALALDTNGKPVAGVPLEIIGSQNETISHRKRMVGGFYSFENEHNKKPIGSLCSGKSNANGVLVCEVTLEQAGNVSLEVRGKDKDGNQASAFSSVWVTQQGELWFDAENQDRIDVLPEKQHYRAGDVAQFQVRMPYRHATALVAVEREGIIEHQVVELHGTDPTISVPIKAGFGPNVYVSVLALRGRLRDVPWYSFFTWGWKEPLNWWHEFRAWQGPTALIDLSKPSFKFGLAEIRVDSNAHQLGVTVKTDKSDYPIRSEAKVDVQVLRPDGKPAAGAEVALAVVDEALLELQDNDSWNVLAAMIQRRSYGIETATAQMQVIGKRHFGRKAVAPGGSGGKSGTRELFDTLLLWKPVVQLDAQGRASISVPLNDALTSFRVVAVAESGADQFGTGSARLRTTQDLQIISGLPPLVREGDQFQAMLTLRNTTKRPLQVRLRAKVNGLEAELPEQNLNLAADSAATTQWAVSVPANASERGALQWEISAEDISSNTSGNANNGVVARDSLKVSQRVVPAIPITVQQATLFQLDKSASLKLAQPADSLPGKGGVVVQLTPKLSGAAIGLRRYFETYPFICLEQKTSKAIGLNDPVLWQRMVTDLPGYIDSDGLAYYYPGGQKGSDTLTAYVLAMAHEAGFEIPEASRSKMLAGLEAFVGGKVVREFWSPRKDLEMRKLSAIEALARYGQARPEMLDSIQVLPNQWPTGAVLDWYSILLRSPDWPERAKRVAEAEQILRARMNFQGTRMAFSTEADDYWWWLMSHADVNALRLINLSMDQAAWQGDIPRMMTGALGRQQRAAWASTVSNAWGVLTLNKFAAKFEAEKVGGQTQAKVGSASQSYSWGSNASNRLSLPWPAAGSDAALILNHEGSGKPWVTLQSTAAVVLKAPFSSGYRIKKTIEAVEQKVAGRYSVGDILRITIETDAQASMSWAVLTDPLPSGATLLGSGLGRDSAVATDGEKPGNDGAWLAYQERSFEFFRAYYQFIPKGVFSTSYTVRLNNAGEFNLPATRVEAMYMPEMFGESPNAKMSIK
jgi:uncharacterized protein YfaS (alpha-2-macroglobulin family)